MYRTIPYTYPTIPQPYHTQAVHPIHSCGHENPSDPSHAVVSTDRRRQRVISVQKMHVGAVVVVGSSMFLKKPRVHVYQNNNCQYRTVVP